MHFDIALEIDFKWVLIDSAEVVPQILSVPDHDVWAVPAIDVLNFEGEGMRAVLHDSKGDESWDEEE